MDDQQKNVLIGVFVVAACAIVIFMLLFLHPTVGDEGQTLIVRFSDIDKINVGTRVTYGGKPVGEVVDIREVEDKDNPRKMRDGYVYIYELELDLDSGVKVYNSDEVVARTSGLLGEKSIEINPKAPQPGQKLKLHEPDVVIYANESGSMEETLGEFKELADSIEGTLDSIKAALETLRKEKFWENTSSTMKNLAEITTALNQPDRLNEMLANFQTTSKNIVTVSENAIGFSDTANKIVAKLEKGEGTVGRLLNRDDLYLRTTALMSKGETILDDVNHYGILFNMDKGWQRLRARRANLVERLSTPQEFRNYFNDELNQITTSLARVNMAFELTPPSLCCEGEDDEFRKVFAELLRRVDTLEMSLKLYNQQLMQCDVEQTELCR